MKVSVIMRCNNEERHIGYAIQSVLDFLPESELIIVDDNSVDNSREIISLFKTRNYPIKIIDLETKYTPGATINLALKECKNDIVLILSSHCEIRSLDLINVSNSLKKYKCVFGKQIPIYQGKKINPRYIWSHFIDKKVINMYSKIEDRHFLHNAFAFYDRKYLLKNQFDEFYVGKEDRFWARDLVKAGEQFLYDPSISVNHFWTSNGATWKGIG
tara:strand:- start:130 stop:774 length:645 start_codon:yes stop_codon:yes gene_type:complete